MNLNVKAKTKTVCHWINQGETLHLRKLDNFYSLNIQTFKTSKTSDVERFLNNYDLVSEFQKRLWCNETIYSIYFSSCTSGSICIVLYSLFVCLGVLFVWWFFLLLLQELPKHPITLHRKGLPYRACTRDSR